VDEWEELKRWTAFDLQNAGFIRICDRDIDTDEADLKAFEAMLENSPSEQDLQRFLQDHPRILHPELTSHCRWVKPQQQFGSEFRPDFLTARIDSNPGVRWTLIELQRVDAGLFTQDKRQRTTEQFDEGLKQIIEWRDWIAENGDYARKPRVRNGLGLAGISHQADGLILIGRRGNISAEDRKRARNLTWPHHVEVHTYDWLADETRKTVAFWRSLAATEGCQECLSIRHLTHDKFGKPKRTRSS